MRIALDLDGVLADTMVTFCALLNKRHSTQFTPDSFVLWDAWKVADITKDEFFRTLDEAWVSWRVVPPIEENIGEKVRQIQALSKVDIVTGRSVETVRYVKRWLKEQSVPYGKFVRTASTMAKADLRYDVFIDDSAELMARLSANMNTHGILYTQPWNRDVSAMDRIFRVKKWAQIPKVLGRISAENKRLGVK